VLYYIKHTGKAILNLIQDMLPRLKQFDEEMTKVGTEANQLNQKILDQSVKPREQVQPAQSQKPDLKILKS
jgi:hypothetical protein